jgi:hypothetical protein
MGIIKIYHDKKWILQFLDALYNSIDSELEKDYICSQDKCVLYLFFIHFFLLFFRSKLSFNIIVVCIFIKITFP